MRRLSYDNAVADPERALADLQAHEIETSKSLEDIRAQIDMVVQILDTQRCWAEEFGADPEPAGDHPPPTETSKTPPPTVASVIPPPRRVQVVRLLSQEPTRWWKNRDIAEALDISNRKSLRVLLGQLTQKGELIKTAEAWFRYNDGTSIPVPDEGAVTNPANT
jgi:hypothetical protein